MAPRPPSWPTPIAVIGIVLATLGLAQSAMAIVVVTGVSLFLPSLFQQAFAVQAGGSRVAIVLSVAELAAAVLLLVGSIGLLQRKRRGVALLKWWACFKLALVVLGSVVGWMNTMAHLDEASLQGMNPTAMIILTVLSIMFGALMSAALPVFILIWTSRASVRADVDRCFTPNPARTATLS
ncbi:MAG: hypothetical protein KF724_11345 [Phycisphaeraceae bacterium]|nr:hypothetical protein [Phycisphaeraceae bacterium]